MRNSLQALELRGPINDLKIGPRSSRWVDYVPSFELTPNLLTKLAGGRAEGPSGGSGGRRRDGPAQGEIDRTESIDGSERD
eukprot:1604369-Alexandrium_andersonii.AAC.1